MQKTMKRTLALILAVVLCFSAMPFSAFAVEMTPYEPLSSQAPSSEAPAESSQARIQRRPGNQPGEQRITGGKRCYKHGVQPCSLHGADSRACGRPHSRACHWLGRFRAYPWYRA